MARLDLETLWQDQWRSGRQPPVTRARLTNGGGVGWVSKFRASLLHQRQLPTADGEQRFIGAADFGPLGGPKRSGVGGRGRRRLDPAFAAKTSLLGPVRGSAGLEGYLRSRGR